MSRPHTREQLRRRYLEQASVGALVVVAAALFLSFGLVPASLAYILTATTTGAVVLTFAVAAVAPLARPAALIECPRCNRRHHLFRNHAWLHCDCRAFIVRGTDGPLAVMPLAKVPYPVADPAS